MSFKDKSVGARPLADPLAANPISELNIQISEQNCVTVPVSTRNIFEKGQKRSNHWIELADPQVPDIKKTVTTKGREHRETFG